VVSWPFLSFDFADVANSSLVPELAALSALVREA